ncbi:putative glycosyltransferase EpsJ [Planctopirus ephydatiae]|uniref:Putative glycosyltransferase EpsJ n=1 Tax=Planctopirus ephydatiae TaxID=2528019 RepID=A0A518GI57_9PLAN|nr:glycosyltransferase [Planctopirus ephydatiae]QDV28279.1 putative glycosyltransferase EpsJ [Planctopirus ephydatiae]
MLGVGWHDPGGPKIKTQRKGVVFKLFYVTFDLQPRGPANCPSGTLARSAGRGQGEGLLPLLSSAMQRQRNAPPSCLLPFSGPRFMHNSLARKVTVVIPVYGSLDHLQKCLASLLAWHHVPIVLVDDGNPPSNLQHFASKPGLKIIRQPHRGVTHAWNTGIAAVRTPCVILLNSDVITSGPWIEQLIEPLRATESSLSTLIQLTGAAWQSPTASASVGMPAQSLLAGWCLAFRKSLWHHLGHFDERFRHWYSDTDFQQRLLIASSAHHTSTSPIRCIDTLPLSHALHASTRHLPTRSQLHTFDQTAFFQKWHPEGHRPCT